MDNLVVLLLGPAAGRPWQALERLQCALSDPQQHQQAAYSDKHWAVRRARGPPVRTTASAAAPSSGCSLGPGAIGNGSGSGGGRRWLTSSGPVALAAVLPVASVTLGSVTSAAAAAAATGAATAGTARAVISGSGGGGAAAGSRQLQDFSGTWIKDRERSDSMEAAMDIMRLNGLVRQAVKLVRGVRIEQQPDTFTFTVFSVISWFKVREVYPMSGEQRHFKRRDLRRGKALGCVGPHGRDVQIKLEWGEPHGGTGVDHFRLISEDELHIDSLLQVGGQATRYTTVYTRKPDRRQQAPHHTEPAR